MYTLGVILFELLAQRLPYQLDHLPGHEVARVIQEQEPSRLGSIDTHYRGDVEIIVAKALEKVKNRRYASAGDLASDIRRYLRGEAILARPASALYQLRKFARRHKVPVAAASGIFAALLSWERSYRSFLPCVPPRMLAWQTSGSVPPPTRATAPGSRLRLPRFRVTTLPMPPASWARPRRPCATGNGNTCMRGSTTALPSSPPRRANLNF